MCELGRYILSVSTHFDIFTLVCEPKFVKHLLSSTQHWYIGWTVVNRQWYNGWTNVLSEISSEGGLVDQGVVGVIEAYKWLT